MVTATAPMLTAAEQPLLNAMHEKFAVAVAGGASKTKGAQIAGYSEKTAPQQGCRLFKNAQVQARIRQLQAAAVSSLVMSQLERKERLSEVARGVVTDYLDERGNVKVGATSKNKQAVAEYVIRDTQWGEARTVRLRDPVAAISELNKMEGVYDAAGKGNDNRVQTININVTSEDAKALLERVLGGERTGDPAPVQLQAKKEGE